MRAILIFLLFSYTSLIAQQPDHEGSLVKWMTLDEAMKKQKVQPKPMIIDFYTDWCGWCKKMMKTTYANSDLASYINTYFYPVKFNAEGKDTIEYLGQKYLPLSKEPRSAHSLAVKLLNNKLVYPTTLFLNGYDDTKKEFKLSMIASGMLELESIQPILIFMLENAGRNSSYDDFKNSYQIAYYDTTLTTRLKSITWMEPKDVFGKDIIHDVLKHDVPIIGTTKKYLVLINSSWCNSCKVMKLTSFSDSSYVKYLNEKYILVNFNPDIHDTLYYKDQKFFNPSTRETPFHQLAFTLGRNSLTFPSMIVLDEKKEIIDVIPSYIPPGFMNEIIHYYGDDKFKSKSWQDYMKEIGKNN